jgi:periplasmic divalent cation tolerance protein
VLGKYILNVHNREEIKMEFPYIIVLITVPSEEVGSKISQTLLDQKLAACVSMVPSVKSLFRWEGEVSEEEEILLVAKTRAALFQDRLIPAVEAVHPYDVPEIIALPIVMGNQAYLDWIESETQ